MADISGVLANIHTLANPDALPGMRRFALAGDNRLGISIPLLRKLARKIGTDHSLALELWETAIPEARRYHVL